MIEVREAPGGHWISNGNDTIFIHDEGWKEDAVLIVKNFVPVGPVVYKSKDPLKAGSIYNGEDIDAQVSNGTFIIGMGFGMGSGYAYQYFEHIGGWTSERLDSPLKTLPAGRYRLLWKGES